MSLLYQALNSPDAAVQFNVAGCSFAGFEAEHDDNQKSHCGLYNITEQVDFSLERLRTYIQTSQKQDAQGKPKVILIGHSFGTFVIAEMMKRVFSKNGTGKTEDDGFEIIGSILLFPPLPDLEKSPRGEKIAVWALCSSFYYTEKYANIGLQSILRWQHLPRVASYMAKLVYNLPLSWSNTLIRYFTAFPSDALHTTRTFFGSRTGVAQAL